VALDYGTADTTIDSARREVERRITGGGHPASQFAGTGRPRLVAALKKWVRSRGLIVKSRLGVFVFGEGLPGEEVRLLLAVISRAPVGSS
jgi:hypothetical protein